MSAPDKWYQMEVAIPERVARRNHYQSVFEKGYQLINYKLLTTSWLESLPDGIVLASSKRKAQAKKSSYRSFFWAAKLINKKILTTSWLETSLGAVNLDATKYNINSWKRAAYPSIFEKPIEPHPFSVRFLSSPASIVLRKSESIRWQKTAMQSFFMKINKIPTYEWAITDYSESDNDWV